MLAGKHLLLGLAGGFLSKPTFLISLSQVQSAWHLACLPSVVRLVTVGHSLLYMRYVQVHVFPCMYCFHACTSSAQSCKPLPGVNQHDLKACYSPAFVSAAFDSSMGHKMATAVLPAPHRVSKCKGQTRGQ